MLAFFQALVLFMSVLLISTLHFLYLPNYTMLGQVDQKCAFWYYWSRTFYDRMPSMSQNQQLKHWINVSWISLVKIKRSQERLCPTLLCFLTVSFNLGTCEVSRFISNANGRFTGPYFSCLFSTCWLYECLYHWTENITPSLTPVTNSGHVSSM